MRTLITGAGGFVGQSLLHRLLEQAGPDDRFWLADIEFPTRLDDPRLTYVQGPLNAPNVLIAAMAGMPEQIFHLATVAGRQSVANFALGRETNLDSTIALLEHARVQGQRPRFVFASSLALFAPPLPSVVNDETTPSPSISYASHKWVSEILINDYTRASFIDGVSLRLPGILARPSGSTTMLSAFLSDVFYAAQQQRPFILPLAANEGSWAMSIERCVDNFVHAATLPKEKLGDRRNWSLPVILLRMQELIDALSLHYGEKTRSLITCVPDPDIQALFSQCPLEAAGAEELGFRNDGNVQELVSRVINHDSRLSPIPNS